MSTTNVTIIDLVRHADVYNPRDVFYGRLPRFGLSTLGRQQASALASVLAGEPVAAIYSSPLLRARQTAAILRLAHPAQPPLHTSRLLIEVGSQWQGRPSTDLDAIGYDFFSQAAADDERIVDVFYRMERLLRRLARRYAGRQVVCVSHADPIMIARVGLLGRPLRIDSLRNQPDYPAKASISRLRFDTPTSTPTLTYLPPPLVGEVGTLNRRPTTPVQRR